MVRWFPFVAWGSAWRAENYQRSEPHDGCWVKQRDGRYFRQARLSHSVFIRGEIVWAGSLRNGGVYCMVRWRGATNQLNYTTRPTISGFSPHRVMHGDLDRPPTGLDRDYQHIVGEEWVGVGMR